LLQRVDVWYPAEMVEATSAVRKAELADRDAIVGIDRGIDHHRRAQVVTAIKSGHCLVLDDGDGIKGFVVTRPKAFFGRDLVGLLMVDAQRRRTGVGRRLLQAAVRAASTNRVFISTNRSNAPMQALLAREQWSLSGEVSGLDEGDPELVYYIDRTA
jgi:GNAT superfamily N-acetyltransferase